jgi:hypothetical protein
MFQYRWEYSGLAKLGDKVWLYVIDPVLRFVIGNDETTSLQRLRAGIQITVLVAVLLLPMSLFWHTAHMLTAAGLLFDIAGATRIFLLEEIDYQISQTTPNEHDNHPSSVMRELIMPEGTSECKINDNHVSFFYYKKRGVLFLFFGFALQMIADIIG